MNRIAPQKWLCDAIRIELALRYYREQHWSTLTEKNAFWKTLELWTDIKQKCRWCSTILSSAYHRQSTDRENENQARGKPSRCKTQDVNVSDVNSGVGDEQSSQPIECLPWHALPWWWTTEARWGASALRWSADERQVCSGRVLRKWLQAGPRGQVKVDSRTNARVTGFIYSRNTAKAYNNLRSHTCCC